jgi:AcrR family transcriptional regulator
VVRYPWVRFLILLRPGQSQNQARKGVDVASHRPPDRKEQIRDAATALFLERGYHNVSVAEIAQKLDITGAAIYYHYRDKQELLLSAVLHGLDTVDGLITEAPDLDAALRSLVGLVVGPRRLLAIWERQARYLEGSQRDTIRAREAELSAHLVPLIQAARPELEKADAELIGWAVLGALGGQARRRTSQVRRDDEELMFRLGSVAAYAPLPSSVMASAGSAAPSSAEAYTEAGLRRPRRDQLLTQAIQLFDERGYQSVTMADIGEAAGIVASGVYRHFPGKADLLVAAVNRGEELLRAAADHAMSSAASPREALDLLLREHIAISVGQRHLVGILTHERDELPDKERTALRRSQADYLDVWLQALSAAQPGRDPAKLKTIISATHSMLYLVGRSGRIDQWPGLAGRLTAIGSALLLDA